MATSSDPTSRGDELPYRAGVNGIAMRSTSLTLDDHSESALAEYRKGPLYSTNLRLPFIQLSIVWVILIPESKEFPVHHAST
jgi:hypothetical protein